MRNQNLVYKKLFNTTFDETASYEAASYSGIAKKTFLYLGMVVLGAFLGIALGMVNASAYLGLIITSSFLTFFFSIVAMTSPRLSKVFGILYCLFEGVSVGFVSMVYSAVAGGAVLVALLSTLSVFAIVTTLFVTNIVKVNSKFIRFLVTFSISFIVSMAIFMLIMAVSGQKYSISLCWGISAITVFLASLYLLMDLDNIRVVVEGGYPKEMEWYAAFGLAFTLVWLYIEILRIVAVIFADRN